jgi:outer membrane protein OmpA-like peptidoglycan-associated protein
MKRLAYTSLLLAGAASAAQAQVKFPSGDADNGTHSNTILSMGITPRGVGLGGAMGAVEGDPSSIFYNAAGIARLKTNSFLVTGARGFGQSQLVAAAVTFPTTLGTFAIGARAFNDGTIDVTEGNVTTGARLRGYQLELQGGGAIELTRHWLWGGTLFYSQETLGSDSRGSIGLNSAMMFPDIFSRLTLGGGVRNYGTPVRYSDGGEGFRPPFMGFGAASFDLFKRRNLLATPLLFKGQPIIVDAKLVGQADFEQKEEPIGRGGIEATVNGVVIGRVGYQTGDDNRKGISLGAGINVGQFRLEYAFRNRYNAGAKFFSDDPVGDEHHVGATYFFGMASTNVPLVPVIVTQPVDTAAINSAIRSAMEQQLATLRPLLDSLRNSRVEITRESDLIARYVVPVHFGFDSAAVRDSDFAVLGQIADVIRRIYPNALVTIEGFADPAGSPQYNLALSRRRAQAVRDVMTSRFRLPTGQFKTVGYGESSNRQVAPGAQKNADGAESNRRVVFTIDATQHF